MTQNQGIYSINYVYCILTNKLFYRRNQNLEGIKGIYFFIQQNKIIQKIFINHQSIKIKIKTITYYFIFPFKQPEQTE